MQVKFQIYRMPKDSMEASKEGGVTHQRDIWCCCGGGGGCDWDVPSCGGLCSNC